MHSCLDEQPLQNMQKWELLPLRKALPDPGQSPSEEVHEKTFNRSLFPRKHSLKTSEKTYLVKSVGLTPMACMSIVYELTLMRFLSLSFRWHQRNDPQYYSQYWNRI